MKILNKNTLWGKPFLQLIFDYKELLEYLNNNKNDLNNIIILNDTGIYDKNNTIICEGDIIKKYMGNINNESVYQYHDVIFHKGVFLLANIHSDNYFIDYDLILIFENNNDLEIVGNIYETPELQVVY